MMGAALILILIAAILVVAYLAKRSAPPPKRKSPPPGRATPVARASKPVITVSVSTPRQLDRAAPLVWNGLGSAVDVAGLRIRDGLFYTSESTQWRAVDPAEVLVTAEARRPRAPLEDVGYWPWYSRLPVEHRFAYLEWLAAGKPGLPPLEGFLFLYYYGIERRLLVDQQDRPALLREIIRLRKLDALRRDTKNGASFRRYSTSLMWLEVTRTPEQFDRKGFDTVCALTETWSAEAVAPALGWCASQSAPAPAWLARRCASLNERSTRSVVIKRVPREFEELFEKRYRDTYGEGIALRVSKRSSRQLYKPASAALREVSCEGANVLGVPSQLEPLADLWNSCVEDLRGLSKVGGSVVTSGLSSDAWEALPVELRRGVDHPLSRAVQKLALSAEESGGVRTIVVSDLARLMDVEARQRLTAGQSRRIAETLEHCGHCVEPDARATGRAYEWSERVALFLRVDDAPVDLGRYSSAACMLRLGLAVAEADGVVDAEEMRRLTAQIEAAFQMPDHERARLEALRALLVREGSDLASVARKIQDVLPAQARESVGRLLVAIAAADGVIDRKEQAALRRCYRALGLGPEVLDRVMDELAPASSDGLVTVQAGAPSPRGEAIPQPGGAPLVLDRAAISAIMAETREVARILHDVMTEDDGAQAEAVQGATVSPVEADATVATLEQPPQSETLAPSGRYGAFYAALVARDSWAREEAEQLARASGVMLSGAVEAINDWAFDALGGPLLDDSDDSILIDRSLLQRDA